MSRHKAALASGPSLTEPAGERWLESVRERVLAGEGPITPVRVAAAVRASGHLLGTVGALEAVERVSAELNGLGPLHPLLKDAAVTDIFVNGPDDVWLDRGCGAERSDVRFTDEAQVRSLANRLAASGGRRLDDGCPCVDVRLEGGYRIHAVIPPVSARHTLLSIRIPRASVFTLEDLRAAGTVPEGLVAVLSEMIDQRLNFLISGATGSGKTTLLSTLLGLAKAHERLILIEDSAELSPAHHHVVGLQSRHRNIEGEGAVELPELVRQALRMRPDRLIVGECRGAEVRDLLSALNTGHSGGCGTIHANSSQSVPARLIALGALAGLTREAVALQASSALDAVIHIERTPSGRQVTEIGMFRYSDAGGLVVEAALSRARDSFIPGPAWDRLAALLKIKDQR